MSDMDFVRAELRPPTYDDFDVIKEAFLSVADEPDASVMTDTSDNLRLYVKLERTFVDLDFLVWPPLTIVLSGLIKTLPNSNKLVLRYRELAHNSATEGSSVNHDYVFATEGNQLTEFGQSIRACPELRPPRQLHYTQDELLDEADRGAKILRQQVGTGLEVTAGDCGVLFDRMLNLMG